MFSSNQDVQYTDIDYLERQLDFKLSPRFSGLPELINKIRAEGMRYIPILVSLASNPTKIHIPAFRAPQKMKSFPIFPYFPPIYSPGPGHISKRNRLPHFHQGKGERRLHQVAQLRGHHPWEGTSIITQSGHFTPKNSNSGLGFGLNPSQTPFNVQHRALPASISFFKAE